MNKQLPAKDYFLLCDDLRPEGPNKTSLLGFLGSTGTIINVQKQDKPVALPSLAFVVSLLGGEGTFKYTVGLSGPDNEVIVKNDSQDLTFRPNQTTNIGFKITPFPVKNGPYRLYVELDGTRYDYHFSVSLHESKSNLATAKTVGSA